MSAKKLWTVDDVAHFLQKSPSWVYKRTAKNCRHLPKLPRIAHLGQPRFDPEAVMALFSTDFNSSLKLEKKENHHTNLKPLETPKGERKFKGV